MNNINKTPCASDLPKSMRQKCEVWTRVMGYHRPTSQFNVGKKQEASERKYFSIDKLTDNPTATS